MAGFGMKRPYPGEWRPFPPPPPMEKRMRLPPPGPGSYWGEGPRPYPDYGSYGDGPYGPRGYPGGYDGPGWGGPPGPREGKAPGWRGGPGPSGAPGNSSNMDFTDDYQAFYGPGNRGRGAFRGRGQGPTRGKPSSNGNQSANQNAPQSGSSSTTTQSATPGGPQRGARTQRGMPPSMFGRGRGRGRGNKPPAVVPPVHTLAKAKPSFPDVRNMSVAEKLHRFCLFMRNDDSIKINAVQTIMNAITSTKLGMKVEYEAEELTRVAGKAMYTGVLRLENVFLARAVGASKKELKQEVFLKAFNIMLSKTVAEIYNLRDPGADAIRSELLEQMEADTEESSPSKVHQSGTTDNMTILETVGADMAQAFASFINVIKNMKNRPDNAISVIEQATTQGHLLVRHQYSFDTTTLNNKQKLFTGKIMFGDIVLGRGFGLGKKLCRAATYTKTLKNIMEKSLAELQVSVPEEAHPELTEDSDLPSQTKMQLRMLPLEERLGELIRSLVVMPYKDGNINPIDVSAMVNGLKPLVVFKTLLCNDSKQLLKCDLYLEKIHLASSESTRRKECMSQVYQAAWETLTTTSVETLMTQHRRITDEDLRDPLIVDIIAKGGGKASESNTAGLRRYGHDLSTVEKNSLEDLVIVEHNTWSTNRVKNSFCILQFSCNLSGLLLHWETETVKKNDNTLTHRCTMFIQREKMGESCGNNKNHAKALAATDALFKLYERKPTIRISNRNDENRWISFEIIKKEADALREQSGGDEASDKTDDPAAAASPSSDPFILKAASAKLNAFGEKRKGELIFGPGIALQECKELRQVGKTLNLKCDQRQHQGETYLSFYEKLPLPKLVEHLRTHSGPYGKYELVPQEDIPSHADVLKNILQNSESVKTDKTVVADKPEED